MSTHLRRDAREARDASAQSHSGYRHTRLSRLLHEELEALVRDDLDDPALAAVRLTYLELSVDYKSARVGFVAPIADGDGGRRFLDRERIARALARATPLLRARLAEAIDLKQVPALRFVWDAVAAQVPEGLLPGAIGGPSISSSAEDTKTMRYEKPEVAEIKMDAEIGSYQNDFDTDPVPFVQPASNVGVRDEDRSE